MMFHVVLKKDEDGWIVAECPALPGCFSQGKTEQEALANIKTLSGLIPICAGCKKIRDDRGYWSQVEIYVAKHSGAKFSHGICPECARKLYPELAES